MSKPNRIIIVAAVVTCALYGAVGISISDEVKNSKEVTFAMHFDKTYAALIERLQGSPGRPFRGISVGQIDYREMLNEAKSLAEHAGPGAELYLKSEVEDQIDRPGGAIGTAGMSISGRFRLALLTLATLGSQDSREVLRNFLSRENAYLGAHAMLVISYLPRQQAKSLLEEVLQNPDRIAEPYALELAVSLLAAIGDNTSMTVLKSLNGKEKRLPPDFLTQQLETMQERLAIKSEKERAERTQHELLYWQTHHDQVNYRVMTTRYYVAAQRLPNRKLKFPVDFLLSKLPDLMAIAILHVQREEAAIPELKKLTTRGGNVGLMAKEALEAISNPPKNAQD